MNQLLQSSIIFLIWATILLQISYKKDVGQHKRQKVFHAIVVMYLVLMHSNAFWTLGWAVGNPDGILEYFYIEKGLFSPSASLGTWILSTIFSLIALTLGLRLAQRKEASLRRIFQLVPAIAIVDWLTAFKGFMGDPLSAKGYIIGGAFITLMIVVPYGLMLFFYSKKTVQNSIFGIKKENNSNQSTHSITGSAGSE